MPVKKNRRIHGEGTIRRKRENLWKARYTTGYDKNGRQIQKSVYGKTPEEVREKLTKSSKKLMTVHI